ncbi:hypothetical protein [Shinella zoogloeoides]|uniref:hypothetical protein n=1 Tax=Shinella zoogloeoides TaxID=352475 RepID=UPI000E658837|nr:hypothetical protein [Shinella zoogloeoides]
MNEISIGAVGAALIAGLVSLLGLIIGKEQKVSEFRQAWVDELRKCLVAYLVNINAICDALRLRKAGKSIDDAALLANYKLLNEANHGIRLRVNAAEAPAEALLKSMTDFEALSTDNASLTPDRIRVVEQAFVEASKGLLKFEWNRVKRGEKTFVWTKRVVCLMIASMLAILVYAWATTAQTKVSPKNNGHLFQLIRLKTADSMDSAGLIIRDLAIENLRPWNYAVSVGYDVTLR